MQNNAEEKGKFYVQTLENAVNTYCDMYKTNNVMLKDLKSEGLFKTESSNGVRTNNLQDEANFYRENGTVKFNNKELEIPVRINGANYICSKAKCIKSS